MASPTNPNLPDSSIERSLDAGLAALKVKDYSGASAHPTFNYVRLLT